MAARRDDGNERERPRRTYRTRPQPGRRRRAGRGRPSPVAEAAEARHLRGSAADRPEGGRQQLYYGAGIGSSNTRLSTSSSRTIVVAA